MNRAALLLLLLLLPAVGCRSLELWTASVLGREDLLPWRALAEWGPEDVAVGARPSGLPEAVLAKATLAVPPDPATEPPTLVLVFNSPPVGAFVVYGHGPGPLYSQGAGGDVLRVKDSDGRTLALRLWLVEWPACPPGPGEHAVPVVRLRGRAWME